MCDRGRQLAHGRHAIDVRQLRLRLAQGLFRQLALRDVPPDAAVAGEAPVFIKDRQPRDGYVALATVGRRSRELEVTERQVRVKRLPMLAPGFCIGLQIGHFPARLAELGAPRRSIDNAFGELLTSEAMLRVALPVHVERELHERAKALLARAELLLGPLALGQIKHKRDSLAPAFIEQRPAHQHGHAAAVLPEILLLERLHASHHL